MRCKIDNCLDLFCPRIIELFKQSPGAYLGLLFRQFEGWLKKAFNHDYERVLNGGASSASPGLMRHRENVR